MRWASLILVLAACGTDVDPACRQTTDTYQTVGEPYIASWCRGCHSADLPVGQRQGTPGDVNFDTLDEVHTWSAQIDHDLQAGTMPPAGGPSQDETQMMTAWLRCGAP